MEELAYMCLEDFNKLVYGTLVIDLTHDTVTLGGSLINERAVPGARITKVELLSEAWAGDDFRKLTDDELNSVLVDNLDMTLRGLAGENVTHQAPNGRFFTVRDVLKAVEETERRTRSNTEWFGGIDIHHIFFEGLTERGDFFEIGWGS